MAHPLVRQLRFTRSEFLRGVKGVRGEDGRKRLLPMNCMAWNVGHLAAQEQRYFLGYAQGQVLIPEINQKYAYGSQASTPDLSNMLKAWRAITKAADPWLDTMTSAKLEEHVISEGKPIRYTYGNMLQRVIYHYWYHTGENQAIRQLLGHARLPSFIGAIDTKAPYKGETAEESGRGKGSRSRGNK